MLYKGADLIRDIEWVIFDEVHYVNDLEVSDCIGPMQYAELGFSVVWFGKKSSSCYQNMSVSYCSRLPFRIPKSLPIGLGVHSLTAILVRILIDKQTNETT